MAETIKMRCEEPAHEGGPTEADVHPDEVENWQVAGWRIVDELPAAEVETDAEPAITVAGAAERATRPRQKGK